MNVCLISAFRNAVPYVGRYFEQVGALELALLERKDALHLVLGEGDSIDDTRRMLNYMADGFYADVLDCTHGGKEFGSVIDPERFRQLAHVGRCLWAAIPETADVVLFVESDLIWCASTMIALLDRLFEYPAIAPAIILQRDGWPDDTWYDVWAFRRNDEHFRHNPPYHAEYTPDAPFRVDSVGSCVVMGAALARHLAWDECLWPGMCDQIYKLGGEVWIDPLCKTFHR